MAKLGPEEVEVQLLDDISCLINEAPVGGGGGDKLGMESLETSMQDVLKRMKLLEEQVTACLQAQPLLYQVFGKCNVLEERIKTIKEEIDGKLDELTKTPVTEVQESSQMNRAKEPGVRSPETANTNAADADSDSDWQPPNSDGEQNEEQDSEDFDGGDALELPEDASMSCDIRDGQMDTDQFYVCKVCFPKVEFDDAEALANHYTSCHSITDEVNITVNRRSDRTRKDRSPNATSSRSERKNGKKSNLEGSMDADGNLSSRTCPKCRRIFQTPSHMTQHLASDHLAIICEFCDVEFSTRSKIAAHKKAAHGKEDPKPRPSLRIPCPDGCGKTAPNRKALWAHIQRCRRVQPRYHQCDDCEVKYTDVRCLLAHRVRVHGHVMTKEQEQKAEKARVRQRNSRYSLVHYCETCGMGFGTLVRLQIHQRKHTGELPFSCEHCDKAFREKGTLRDHMVLHTGKPFVCDECGWAFQKARFLRNHKESHRRGTFQAKVAAARGLNYPASASGSGAIVTGVGSTGTKSAKTTLS